MLIVSRPILPSEAADGEIIRGSLIMGRLLDKSIVQAIRDQTQVALEIIDLDHDPFPPEATGLATNEIRVVEESPEILRVLTHTHDVLGRDILAFAATVPRLIMARGLSAIRLSMLAAGIAGFVFLFMFLFAMKWLVSDPLQRLSRHVKGVGLARGMAPAPLAERHDEIGEVAREFNAMLERLQAEEAELITAETALRASQARTRTILETAPDAIVIIGMDGKIESANQAAADLFGPDGGPLTGVLAENLIAPENHQLWHETLHAARLAALGSAGNIEAEMIGRGLHDKGVPIHISVTTTELEGTPFYTCAMRDISTLKTMQEKVARNQHLARIGEMGATVAHEIRNPLAGMKGALQIIAGGTLDAEEHGRILEEVLKLIDRISGTVEQLLRFAKPLQPEMETFVLRNMVDSICDGVTPEPPAGTEVVIAIDESFTLHADPRLFRQVLENIWANACQALRPPGRIEWRAFHTGDNAELQLFNDGPPIRETDLPHVFEPFFTTRVEGSGLGLAVSQRIVEAHEGTLRIENRAESGVIVIIRIPRGE
jgi:PAS domain S-box-containing protein